MRSSKLERLQAAAKKRNTPVDPVAAVPEARPAKYISQDQHFTTAEIAERWSVHPSTVRRIFGSVVGVLKLGTGKYKTLLVPARVLEDVHQQLVA